MGNFTALAISINNGNPVQVPAGQPVLVPITIWNPPIGFHFTYNDGSFSPPAAPFSGGPSREEFLNHAVSVGAPMTDFFTVTGSNTPGETSSMSFGVIGRPHNVPNPSDDWDTAGGSASASIITVPPLGGIW